MADDSTALYPVCIFIATNHSFTDRAAAVKNKDAATVVANDAFAKATAIMGSAGETRFLVIGSASASAPVAIMNVTAGQLQRLLTASGDATIGMYTYAFKPKVITRAPTVELSRNHAIILVLMPDAASKDAFVSPNEDGSATDASPLLRKLQNAVKKKFYKAIDEAKDETVKAALAAKYEAVCAFTISAYYQIVNTRIAATEASTAVTIKLECEITPGPNDKECKIYEILPKLPEYFFMKVCPADPRGCTAYSRRCADAVAQRRHQGALGAHVTAVLRPLQAPRPRRPPLGPLPARRQRPRRVQPRHLQGVGEDARERDQEGMKAATKLDKAKKAAL